MKINGIVFGAITIDGKTYKHDVVVRLSGEVVKRKKKLSKRLFGSSHMLSEDEGKFLFEKGCDQVVIGSGQMCNVHLSPEAEACFDPIEAHTRGHPESGAIEETDPYPHSTSSPPTSLPSPTMAV